MGQEVKNPLRAQSKYGLMGSSAKIGKDFFRGSPDHFLHKNAIWDRTPPHLHINCSLHVCGRVQGSQIFKQNSIISIRSKVMAFLVISLSPWSPHCPRHSHIVHIIPTSSLCHLHHPHVIPIAPKRSLCGPHGCGLCGLHPMLSPWSLHCPCHPCHPHVIPISSLSSPCHPHSPQKVPMWSPWLWSPWSPPHVVPIVPIVAMSSPSSPHCLHCPYVIPTSSRRFPHHPQPPRYPLHPPPTPWGWGAMNQ